MHEVGNHASSHALSAFRGGPAPPPPPGHLVAIANAQKLSRTLRRQCLEVEAAVTTAVNERNEAERWDRINVEIAVRQRSLDFLGNARVAERSASTLESIIVRLEEAIDRVQQQRLWLVPKHKVCEKRLNIRKQRLDHDESREMLEVELKTIHQAHDRFVSWEHQAQPVLSDLRQLREELANDATARRLLAESDKASLGTGRMNVEPTMQMPNIQDMLVRADELRQSAEGIIGTVAPLTAQSRQEVSQAAAWVEQHLVQEANCANEAARRLWKQTQAVDASIDQAEVSLTKSRRQLDPFKDPRDQVIFNGFADGCKQLETLRKCRQSLNEQLQQKLSSLKIDSTCRKLDPQLLETQLTASGAVASPIVQRRRRPASASVIGCRAQSVPALQKHVTSSPQRKLNFEDAWTLDSSVATTASVAGSPARAVRHLGVAQPAEVPKQSCMY